MQPKGFGEVVGTVNSCAAAIYETYEKRAATDSSIGGVPIYARGVPKKVERKGLTRVLGSSIMRITAVETAVRREAAGAVPCKLNNAKTNTLDNEWIV